MKTNNLSPLLDEPKILALPRLGFLVTPLLLGLIVDYFTLEPYSFLATFMFFPLIIYLLLINLFGNSFPFFQGENRVNKVFFYQIKKDDLFRFKAHQLISQYSLVYFIFLFHLVISQVILGHNHVLLIIRLSLLYLLTPFFCSFVFLFLPGYPIKMPPFKNILITLTPFVLFIISISFLPLVQAYTFLGYYSYLIALLILTLSCFSLLLASKHLKRSDF